ncbi:unnamed protein product [Heterosigma akashiwo]
MAEPPTYHAAVNSSLRQPIPDNDHLMMEDVKLYKNTRERQRYDRLAEFYAIIKTTEHLENARLSNSIDKEEYARECTTLIQQFKDTESVLIRQNYITDTSSFQKKYPLDCVRMNGALRRHGLPSATKDCDETTSAGLALQARQAAEATQAFITAMDALKLEQRAVQPLVADVMDRLTRLAALPADFAPTQKIEAWLKELNGLRAADELGEDQARQLLHDLDAAYSGFFRFLESERGGNK